MINWKLRFKNKITLTAIVTLAISLVYQVLNIIGVIPTIDQQQIIDIAMGVIDLLAMIGVIVDPTTEGVSDSSRAMSYVNPATEYVNRHDDDRRGL